MSFAKAKIQRFNELKECTPSPAKYNVQTQEKIKLGVIAHPKKQGSCSGSETGSVHSTPIFQTPTVPKKKKFLGLVSTTKSKNKDHCEELREKIVECSNKDAYISELTDQIEEMRGQITRLELENAKLARENEDFSRKNTTFCLRIKEIGKELRSIQHDYLNLNIENCKEFAKIADYVNKFQDAAEEIEDLRRQLKEKEAKIKQLEENFKEVSLLTEMQTKEKINEIEAIWKTKLEEKEKEYEAILKECQEISEYTIMESEIEKNQLKTQLEEQESIYNELTTKYNDLDIKSNQKSEDLKTLINEKHAYELSISTFRDTIEVLKKRLIDSDRDVEQLKEELARCEEKILIYEKKNSELTNNLSETQIANEELEMQYESTSKIMQSQVKVVEINLLGKVEILQKEMKQLLKDKELLNDILQQFHEQQDLLNKAEETIIKSQALIESQERKNEEIEAKLEEALKRLILETEEAAEIRKKYIEKSGQFDILSQQLEELTQQLDLSKENNQELREQIEAYENELKILLKEKEKVELEAKDLSQKYAEIIGHQNHNQKIKHLSDLKVKTSELFEKNMDLEAKNFKLNKLIEKMKKEIEDLRKGGKKMIKVANGDKENLGSPNCVKSVQSPGPLKEKN